MGRGGKKRGVIALVLFALVYAQATFAGPLQSSLITVECESGIATFSGAPVLLTPERPTFSTADLTTFINDSFNDPSLVFRQPFTGCQARAHILAKRLTERGAKVRKIFAEGNLLAKARDGKEYAWQGHVAVMVEITDNAGGFSRTREMVIDPALFDHPVTEMEWKLAVQHGDSSRADFSYGPGNRYEPPSNVFISSDPNYYDDAAKRILSALTILNSLPDDAQKEFQLQMRFDRRLNVAWDVDGFMQRWGDPVFRRAWIEREIKPGPGQDLYDSDYWRNWKPPR